MPKKSRSAFFLCGVLMLSLGVGYLLYDTSLWKVSAATAIITSLDHCKTEKDHTICHKKSITQLLKEYSLQDVLTVLEKNDSQSTWIRTNCHILTHMFGQNEYKNTKNIETSLQACTNYCWSGCYHGVAEGYYLTEKEANKKTDGDMLNDVLGLCKNKLSSAVSSYCSQGDIPHGIGHILMYFTNDDVSKSLHYCDGLENQRYKTNCYEGVFMVFSDNAQKDTNTPLQSRIDKNPLYPCNLYEEKYTKGCYQALATRHENTSMQQRIQRCNAFPLVYQEICYRLIAQSNRITDINEFKEKCNEIPVTQHKKWCIQGTATFLYGWNSIDYAIEFCSVAPTETKKGCYDELYQRVLTMSKNTEKFCESIAEKEYSTWCK